MHEILDNLSTEELSVLAKDSEILLKAISAAGEEGQTDNG